MHTKLLTIFMPIFIIFFSPFFGEDYSKGNTEIENQTEVFLISPQDLLVIQNDLFVNIDGFFYRVYSLEKNDSQWITKVFANTNYCPEGHPTCRNCHLCHKEGCRYFVKHCNLWN